MSLHVRSLASGSSGNAFLVWTPTSVVLVDAGLSARRIERALQQQAIDPASLSAIVLSHEHHDHAQGVGPLARRYRMPIVATPGTIEALRPSLPGATFRPLHDGGLTIGDLDLWSFPIPHDANDPAGVLLHHDRWTVGVALDCGHVEPPMIEALREADLIVVEANHDREMLLATAYPWATKHRIMSDRGHLSNMQAAQLLHEVGVDGRRRDVWLAHLSEHANDHPQGVIRRVRNTLDVLGPPPFRFAVAERDRPSAAWHSDLTLTQGALFAADDL